MLRKWIVCGLGNPGERYHLTRHNMGFLLLDVLTERYSLSWTKPAREYSLSEFNLGETFLVFLKPAVYMNLSGNAVRAFGTRESFEPQEFLVLCDDFALPLGWIRLRRRGSDGGHNGLRSVIGALFSEDFPRLRVGVGPVPEGVDPADFVLNQFIEEERRSAAGALERAADCFERLINRGFEEAMGEFNAPPPDSETD